MPFQTGSLDGWIFEGYITTGPITRLFELGETDWHETVFRTVVASLAR